MEHVVFFPAPDGTPAFRRLASLEDAARFVEHLRNVEGVTEASVHALTEVPLSFKAWYRVEIPGAAIVDDSAVAAAPAEPAPVAAPLGAPSLEAPSLEAPAFEIPGSATGILVPPAADPAPVAAEPLGEPAPEVVPEPVDVGYLAEPFESEPVPGFEQLPGGRRERGLGFFAR